MKNNIILLYNQMIHVPYGERLTGLANIITTGKHHMPTQVMADYFEKLYGPLEINEINEVERFAHKYVYTNNR